MEPFILRLLKENTVMKISFTKVPESQQMDLAQGHSKEKVTSFHHYKKQP